MINPNRLEGNEGQLLQVTKTETGFASCSNIDSWKRSGVVTPTGWEQPKDIKRGTVGMFIACGSDEYNNGWIDFLADEKVYRIFFPYNRWMEHFIPWPRGAFIGK